MPDLPRPAPPVAVPPYPDWAGFDAPRYTPVPDDVFDLWLPHRSGAELKVLLYICRRTFGFKKTADRISFAQLTHGITTAAGRTLDYGTGLSVAGAQTAVKGLLAHGLICKATQQAPDGGNAPTTYRLRLRGDAPPPPPAVPPSANNWQRGMLEIGIPLCQKLAIQETALQETDSQETALQETDFESRPAAKNAPIPPQQRGYARIRQCTSPGGSTPSAGAGTPSDGPAGSPTQPLR